MRMATKMVEDMAVFVSVLRYLLARVGASILETSFDCLNN